MGLYYEEKDITIYHGDCREILPEIGEVDLVLTDPPYGIGADKNLRANTQYGRALAPSKDYGFGKWDSAPISQNDMDSIIKKGQFACIWGGNYYLFSPSPSWLVWDKQTGDNQYADVELAWTNYGGAARIIIHLWKGMFRKDKEPRFHPTQKPLGVIKWALELAPKNETILDPFLGSGTTLVAAKQLKRKAIGIEIEEKYCEIAVKRLQEIDKNKERWETTDKDEKLQARLKEFKKRARK